jgi:hypothetical protein
MDGMYVWSEQQWEGVENRTNETGVCWKQSYVVDSSRESSCDGHSHSINATPTMAAISLSLPALFVTVTPIAALYISYNSFP